MIGPRKGGLLSKMNDEAELFDGFGKLDLSMFGPEGAETSTDAAPQQPEAAEPALTTEEESAYPLTEAVIRRPRGEPTGLSLVQDPSGRGCYVMAIQHGSPASKE